MHNINLWGSQYRCAECGKIWDTGDTPPETCEDPPTRQRGNYEPFNALMEDNLERMSPDYFKARKALIAGGRTHEEAMRILNDNGL